MLVGIATATIMISDASCFEEATTTGTSSVVGIMGWLSEPLLVTFKAAVAVAESCLNCGSIAGVCSSAPASIAITAPPSGSSSLSILKGCRLGLGQAVA